MRRIDSRRRREREEKKARGRGGERRGRETEGRGGRELPLLEFKKMSGPARFVEILGNSMSVRTSSCQPLELRCGWGSPCLVGISLPEECLCASPLDPNLLGPF